MSTHRTLIRFGMRWRAGSALLLAASACAIAAPASSAAEGDLAIETAYAAPIRGDEVRCTPEPGGRLVYGTQVPFDPTRPISSPTGAGAGYPGSVGYVPANMPSTDTIAPALQAGASTDLCLGFTLTPNVEPGFIRDASNPNRGRRLQDDPPLPDVEATRVLDDADHDDMRDIAIDLPAGFAAAPGSVPECSSADFGVGNYKLPSCDAATQVGTAYLRLSTSLGGLAQHVALGGLANLSGELDGGEVFNLDHGPDELARLGVEVTPVGGLAPTKFTVRLTFAPDGSGRVRAIVDDAPRHVFSRDYLDPATGQLDPGTPAWPLYVESVGIRAWGAKADHPTLPADFAQIGTSCESPVSADVDITTYGGVRMRKTSPGLTLTGCEQLPFAPTVSVATTERRPAAPTGATITVEVPQSSTGPRSALLRSASVTLPAGLELGAQAATRDGGLGLCTATEFAAKSTTSAAACAASSRAGDVRIETPLLAEPLTGSLFLGEQSAVGELPALYLEAALPGANAADAARIKLVGQVSVDEQGQLTTVFEDVPQLRFSKLQITFPEGPSALFRTPRTCGTTTGVSQLTSWASATPQPSTASLTIDQDCELPPFAPEFSMAVADPTVGASSPTTVRITRADRSPWLQGVRVALPAGFLANLNAATECGGIEASRGDCPESARIATVRTVAGAGERPLTLEGAMYLRARDPGAVAAAQILVRAKIGAIDLGTVNVPARIDLRTNDAGLVLTTEVPRRFRGLSLELREITVDLDRPGFPLNPTACGPLAASADFTSEGGATAARSTAVAFTGCGARPFQPGFQASLTGDTKPGGHPQVNVRMTPRPGDANLRSATVMLPAGVSTDLKNLQAPCPTEAFEAVACPAQARVGTATARVSITPEVIQGDVFLVRIPGQTLPGLGMSFTGRYAQRVLSTVRIDKSGRVVTDFATIPDLPLTQLDLVVDGGSKSPIQLSPKACTEHRTWDGTFGGQGGQTAKVSAQLDCDAALVGEISPTMSRTKGLSVTIDADPGERIRYTKLTLGTGFRLQQSARLRRYVISRATGAKLSERRRSSKSFFVTYTGKKGAGPNELRVRAGLKSLRLPSKYRARGLRKGARIQVRIRTVLDGGKVNVQTRTVKVK